MLGTPYTLLLRIEARGFPTFWLLLYVLHLPVAAGLLLTITTPPGYEGVSEIRGTFFWVSL